MILLGMQVAKQPKDISKGELGMLRIGNEARAINTLYISGLDTAIRVEEERTGEEDGTGEEES